MASLISDIITTARIRLIEPTANFWTDAEFTTIVATGIRDLWRDVVDLKQEHYLIVDTSNVTLPANSSSFSGVPTDVHKVYMVEPVNLTQNGANHGLIFRPEEYNSPNFQQARTRDAVDPSQETIFYAITKQGAPVNAPTILIAPQVTSAVSIAFTYVPSLGTLTSASTVPIPGEADNALVAWTIAFARAKEREDRGPDPAWLAIYASEKAHLLQSLGLRQYQEPSYVSAIFGEYW